jgi:hypothetical protein
MDVEVKVTPKNINNSDIKNMRRVSKRITLKDDLFKLSTLRADGVLTP